MSGELQTPQSISALLVSHAASFPVSNRTQQCLRHMRQADVRVACEVGDGAGELEDAVVGAGGEL
ncbi:MAG TPA: hypothetical protein VGK19_18055 [Capsulimonadaceae bacterium]